MAQVKTAFDDVGTRLPIIFLHGYPFNRSMWIDQIAFLSANGYRCIAPDLRGLGENGVRSSAFRRPLPAMIPPEGGTPNLQPEDVSKMDDMARDVAALMDKLHLERAVICGLSMENISVPTLIIAGREDGVRRSEDAEFIHDCIKNSRLEVLADAGHLMNMEQAEQFNDVLLRFLSSLDER